MRISRVVFVALGASLSCGGREAPAGDRGPSRGAPADAGADAYLESLHAPAGTRMLRSSFEPRPAECETSNDCAAAGTAGAACAAVAGSYRVCVPQVAVATAPTANPSADECDATRPCVVGACYASLLFPSGQCGLGGATPRNACLADTCQSDDDCEGGVCGPPGLMSSSSVAGGGIRQCFGVGCLDDGDCALADGGVCAFVASSCGGPSVGRAFRPAQMACVYPGGCSRDSDCGQGWCSIIEGTAVCLAPQN